MSNRPSRPTIRKAFRAKDVEGLKRELTGTISDLQRQLGSQGQILPHNVNGNRPKGLRKNDRMMGRGARGNVTAVPDGKGGVATQEVPDSVTQYQDPQTGIVAPTVANFPVSGDFGWYYDSVGLKSYWAYNNGGVLTFPDVGTFSGTITAAQHGSLTNNAVARHSNATGSVDGFMSAADKTILDAATAIATNSTLVLRGAGGGITATGLNVTSGATTVASVVSFPDTGWSMAGGLALDKTLVAFTPNATYLASDLTQIMKYVDALFDLVLNTHKLGKA